MTEEPSEKILDLIKKCLALGKSPNEHEAALAMSKAQELLEKYNLSMRDIQTEEQFKAPNMVNLEVPIGSSEWKRYLVHYIAENNFCRVLISGKDIHILGRETNVISVLVMASWIVVQLENIAWVETHTYSGPLSKLRFRNSFLWGAINRIRDRLKEGRQVRTSVDPNLNALVVNLTGEVANYYRQQYPRVSSHHTEAHIDDGAYARGQEAGDRISLYGSNRQVEDKGHLLT